MTTLKALFQRGLAILFDPTADTNTEHGRGRLRLRRAAWSGISNSAASACALAVAFISVPLILRHIGAAEYGVWITLSSVLTWLAMSDAGLAGPALVNALSHAQGRDDAEESKRIISTAFFMLCAIACVIAAVAFGCFDRIPWTVLFNAPPEMSAKELEQAIKLALLCFALSFPAGMISSVYSGLQKGYVAHGWSALSSVISLAALILALRMHGGLPGVVAAYSGARLLVLLIGAGVLFGLHHPELAPRWRHVSAATFQRVFHLGWKYLLQQLANLALFHSQPMILTHLASPVAVAAFSVAQRLLTIPALFVQFFTLPLVPAYGDARARLDQEWMQKTLRRSVKGAVAIGAGLGIPLLLAAPWIISWWASPDLASNRALLVSLFTYALINCAATPFAVFLNGVERVGFMATATWINAAVTLALAFHWVPLHGATGMGMAMMSGLAVNAVLQVNKARTMLKAEEAHRPSLP